jgi:hypothetical protein
VADYDSGNDGFDSPPQSSRPASKPAKSNDAGGFSSMPDDDIPF